MLAQLRAVEPGSYPDSTRIVKSITMGVVAAGWSRSPTEEIGLVYLHAGDGTRPPVELGFDEGSGRLASAQVVLQDEKVASRHVFGTRLIVETGLPIVDLSPWREEEHILDHRFEPLVAWEPAGTLTVRVARTSGQPTQEIRVGDLGLVVDERELVLGFRVFDLTDSEIAILDLR